MAATEADQMLTILTTNARDAMGNEDIPGDYVLLTVTEPFFSSNPMGIRNWVLQPSMVWSSRIMVFSRAIRPETKVTFMSGDTMGITGRSVEFLPKPFKLLDLAGKVGEVLGKNA